MQWPLGLYRFLATQHFIRHVVVPVRDGEFNRTWSKRGDGQHNDPCSIHLLDRAEPDTQFVVQIEADVGRSKSNVR